MNIKSKLLLIIILLLVTGCTDRWGDPSINARWVEIDPPPNIEGPCYLYRDIQQDVASIGVWCK